MALPAYQFTVTDAKGNAVSGASVRVRHEMAGARNAKLKSDRDGTSALGNPATTDSAGFIRFYVASGAYRIDVTFGTTTITWRHVAIGLAAEKAGIAPGITWKFASETADADPGSGFFRLNNSAAGSATELYVSNDDANDTDQTTFLDSLDDGGGTGDRGTLIVQGENADERLVIQVTGTVSEGGGSPSTYRKLSITVQSASLDDLTAGGVFGFLFSQDAAAGGATALDLGDDGANESSAIDEIATQNDTNSVASNPTGDKLLFDMGQNWPRSDSTAAVPAGSIMMWPTNTPPSGWLECDGSAVSRATYADLFSEIGETYGNGDGSTTFNLPDMRGEFPRGWNNGDGADPDAASRTDRGDGTTGDNVGTKQDDEFELHGHPARYAPNSDQQANPSGGINLDTSNQANHAAYTGTPSSTVGEQIGGEGGNETRPRNVALMFIIRAQ